VLPIKIGNFDLKVAEQLVSHWCEVKQFNVDSQEGLRISAQDSPTSQPLNLDRSIRSNLGDHRPYVPEDPITPPTLYAQRTFPLNECILEAGLPLIEFEAPPAAQPRRHSRLQMVQLKLRLEFEHILEGHQFNFCQGQLPLCKRKLLDKVGRYLLFEPLQFDFVQNLVLLCFEARHVCVHLPQFHELAVDSRHFSERPR